MPASSVTFTCGHRRVATPVAVRITLLQDRFMSKYASELLEAKATLRMRARLVPTTEPMA